MHIEINEYHHCPTHPHVRLLCPACTGGKGGRATSPQKAQAAQQNAKKPRPRKAR